jgi:hypothetical protein
MTYSYVIIFMGKVKHFLTTQENKSIIRTLTTEGRQEDA